ncbi:hypothetical protein FCV25MIE_04856 [Fagus crenata]
MASDALFEDWRKFSLTETEAPGFKVEEDAMGESRTIGSKCLLGKLITDKLFNKEALKTTMLRLWGASRGITATNISDNLFAFQFPNEYERTRVLNGAPWLFDNYLLALQEFDGSIPAIQFSSLTLIFGYNSMVKEVDAPENGIGWGSALRVRLQLDFTRPIPRGRLISFSSLGQMWVSFRYERLPWICFHCGLIGHLERDCAEKLRLGRREEPPFKQYGPWLRATESSQRRRVFGNEKPRQGPTAPRRDRNMTEVATGGREAGSSPVISQSDELARDRVDHPNPVNFDPGNPSLSHRVDDEIDSTGDSDIPFISLVDDTAQAVDIEIENIGGAILGEDNFHGMACMQAVHVAANTKSMPIAGPSSSAPNLLHEESNAVCLDDPCLPRTTNDLDGMSSPSRVAVQLRKHGTKSWKRVARKSTKSISTKRGALKRLLELDEEIQSESVTKRPKTNVMGKRDVVTAAERLDRMMATVSWILEFEGAVVTHLPRLSSDHCPLLLDIPPTSAVTKRKKVYRFEALWVKDDQCKGVIEQAWGSEVQDGSPMFRLRSKENVSNFRDW